MKNFLKIHSKSLFWRNFVINICMLLCIFLLFGSYFMISMDRYANEEKEENLKRTASRAAELTALVFDNYSIIMERLYTVSLSQLASDGGADILIYNTSGSPAYYSPTDALGQTSPANNLMIEQSTIDSIIAGNAYSGITTLNGVFPSSMFVYGLPIHSSHGEAIGVVFVASNADRTEMLYSQISTVFAWGILVSLIFALTVSYFVSAKMLSPLTDIANAVKSFSHGKFYARVPVKSSTPTEIASLAESFNNMAASLEQFETQRRDLIANISHDLKTPLTIISGFVDGIIDDIIPKEKHTEYLERVSSECKRLSNMVTKMLEASQNSDELVVLNKTPFNICDMTGRIILNFEQTLNDKQVDVNINMPDKLIVTADKDKIFQAIYNLTDNAVKFVSSHGTLSIKISVSSKIMTFEIANTGDCIPESDIPFIFDRFYMCDHSRGINKQGSGLGLHIVKTNIHLHGGDVFIESKDNLTRFYFKIPVDERVYIV